MHACVELLEFCGDPTSVAFHYNTTVENYKFINGFSKNQNSFEFIDSHVYLTNGIDIS